MKRYILLVALLLTLPQLMSCKKFLEEQSQTDIIPKDITILNELLLGSAYNAPSLNFSGYTIDDNTSNHTYRFIRNFFNMYTWQPDDYDKSENSLNQNTNVWSSCYRSIQVCNVVLEYSEKVTGSEADKNNVTGQAYLIRAFCYFNLVNYFGKPYLDKMSDPDKDLGVPLMLKSAISLEGKPRNTVGIVYQQILADLNKGIELMNKSGKNNTVFRINEIAGHLISSRVNLHMGNWAAAINAANEVLLVKSDLMDLNTWGTPDQNNKPVIVSTNPEVIWAFGASTQMVPGGEEVDTYGLSSDLLNLFEHGDLRNGIYFKEGKSTKRKLVQFYGVKPDKSHILRVSEALLNRAEAYAQLSKLGQAGNNAQLALNDLNTLRKKRFLTSEYQDLTNLAGNDLLLKCFEERRRELFNEENHRWFDLRRTGMPSITHVFFESEVQSLTYKLEDHDPAYLFQIPKEAIDLNPLLIRNPEPSIRLGY